MSVCAIAALLLLANVHSTAGAQLQPQGSAGSGGQEQEQSLQVQQPIAVAESQQDDRQSQQVIPGQEYSLGQQEAAGSVQIQDGVYGREDSVAESPNVDIEAPGANDWIPPNGYIPYPVPAPAEQPPGNPQYEEPPQFAVPNAANEIPVPYADAAGNRAFQAWYAAQRHQRKQYLPRPYVFSYYPRGISKNAAGYEPNRHRPAGVAAISRVKNEEQIPLSFRNSDNVEVADGWPNGVLVPFPRNLAPTDIGSQVPHDSSLEDSAFPEAIPGAGVNKTRNFRSARDGRTKSTHSDKGLKHYRKSSSKPHYATPQELIAPGDGVPGGSVSGKLDPANFVIGNILPGSIFAGMGPRGNNASGKNVPVNISAYVKAPGDLGPLPAFLLPPTQVIHAGNNLTLFYFQLDNSTLKAKPEFSALRNEVGEHATNVAKDEHAEEHHFQDDHEDHHREDDHVPSDHAVDGHAEIGHAGENEHAVGSDSHGEQPEALSGVTGAPSALNRAQRSADDGTFLGKLSEWACLGRTVNGETVYCDSILDYARLVAVLGTATIVVTVIFVLLIHGWARKQDDHTYRKKAPTDAALDDEERTPLRAGNDEGADHTECDFRDDRPKRLFVEFLKRDKRRHPL